MSKLISLNPSNNKEIGSVEESTKQEVLDKVRLANKAQDNWKSIGLQKRIEHLRKVIVNLKAKSEELATMTSKEMGMPITQSRMDGAGAIEYFEWYLDNAEKYLSPEIIFEDETRIHKIFYEPVGTVAAITPWNFPASNFVWMIGQNLVVGNPVVLKHSEEVPLCGKIIEQVFNDSNLPEGVFAEVYGGAEVGQWLANSEVRMICFTGSTNTGKYLYKVAADKFIKVFLELGGSAPGIICKDADLNKVLGTIYSNRYDNCGQICDGLKRLIVHEDKLDEFLTKMTSKLKSVVIGDSIDEKTEIGPLVSKKQLETLESQVEDAVEKGAKVIIGGKRMNNSKGNFYLPTILTNIKMNMRVWTEEVFGPVLPIVAFKTTEEAIELANDTKYGLGGYVFTESKRGVETIASQLETGMIQMNTASYVVPCSPFGGIKESGIGREHGKFGFQDLSSPKLVSIEK